MDTHNLKIFPTPESVVRCIVAVVYLPPCTPPGSASHSTWYYQDKETRPDNQVIESIKQPEWSRNQQPRHCTVSTYTTSTFRAYICVYTWLTDKYRPHQHRHLPASTAIREHHGYSDGIYYSKCLIYHYQLNGRK